MERLREAAKSVLIKRGLEFTLKEKQLECISSIVCDGRDVRAVLLTGYGKSVIYQILPDVFDIMLGTEKSMVLVISPLNALMQDQITKLKDRGISCSLIVTCTFFLITCTIFSLVAISPNKSTLLRLTIYALQHLQCIFENNGNCKNYTLQHFRVFNNICRQDKNRAEQ